MCGIVGMLGDHLKVAELIEGLHKLEYRGYDSAGIAFLNEKEVNVVKVKGRVGDLEKELKGCLTRPICVGIAHTRWATHGVPNDVNAHPHSDCFQKIFVVHNGIVENFRDLRTRLSEVGHKFVSDTDTEVIPHLIEEYFQGDLLEAVRKAVSRLQGTFAIAVMHADFPNLLIAARKGSPLALARNKQIALVASDVTPMLKFTRDVIFLNEGEIAALTSSDIEIVSISGKRVEPRVVHIDWTEKDAEKSGFDHFMLKEIHEEPSSLVSALAGRIKGGEICLPELRSIQKTLENTTKIHVVACGTSFYAALVFKYFVESRSDIDVLVDVSSEFRYKHPHVRNGSIVIAISQSGETADTLESVRLAKKHGGTVISLVNVVGSTLSRESDAVIYMNAGPEIGVAATKSYVNELAILYLIGLKVIEFSMKSREGHRELLDWLLRSPEVVENVLRSADLIKERAHFYKKFIHFMYIGRGYSYPTALEGALKLKEVSYIHATAYQAGELKHGPIAMLNPDFPVFAIAPLDKLYPKTRNNIIECRARNARILALTDENNKDILDIADDVILVKPTLEELYPLFMAPVIQLFAYYTAVDLGFDPDKPRNLAKSVTVE